jgi:hypothetical protein
MILTKAEIFPPRVLPTTQDRRIAAVVCSLFCWMAALWFFVSPWAYFGVSDQQSAWNAWIIGGLMVAASMVRMIAPDRTSGLSAFNAVLSVWVILSPFALGYSSQTGHMVNSLAIGAVALSCSILSWMVTRDKKQTIATPDTWVSSADIH